MPLQTTQTTVTKELPMSERDTPAVLAYRVGQLETSVKEEMGKVNDKLDNLLSTFAGKDDLIALDIRVTRLEGEDNPISKRVIKLESKNTLKETLLWVGLVASAIINIVMVAKVFGAL